MCVCVYIYASMLVCLHARYACVYMYVFNIRMTELAGVELCLPQRPHNQVEAARRRRRILYACW